MFFPDQSLIQSLMSNEVAKIWLQERQAEPSPSLCSYSLSMSVFETFSVFTVKSTKQDVLY